MKLPDGESGSSGNNSNCGIEEEVSTATKTQNCLDLSVLKPAEPIACNVNSDS